MVDEPSAATGSEVDDSGTAVTKYPNLTPWKPGQSGNPTGKRKGLTSELATMVKPTELAARLWELANGEKTRPELRLEAIKYIYAKMEGNPVTAMRFMAEGSVTPLIILHPGREAPELNTTENEAIEAEVADVPARAPGQLGSQSEARADDGD